MWPGAPPNGFDRLTSRHRPRTGWSRRASSKDCAATSRRSASGAKLIALTVLVTTLAAALYVGTAEKTYEAEADMLVTPVPRDDDDAHRPRPDPRVERPDPRRPTAARLVTTIDVARKAKEKLQTDRSAALAAEGRDGRADRPEQPRRDHREGPDRRCRPRTSPTSSPTRSSRTAPTSSHEQVDGAIKALEPRGRSPPTSRAGQAPDPLRDQLTELETLRAGDDPTMRVDTRADKPTEPVLAQAQAEHHRRHHRRARARRRRRVRRPDPRPAPAPRGAAARALPAAGPGPHPRGEPRPRPSARSRRTSSRPRASRPTAPCARRSPRRAVERRPHALGDDHRRLARPRARRPPRSTWPPRSRSPASA